MTVIATSTPAFETVAHQMIAERVRDAWRRAVVRAAQASYDDSLRQLPAWALRFAHPVH